MTEDHRPTTDPAVTRAIDTLAELVHGADALGRIDDGSIQRLFALAVKLHVLAADAGRCRSPFPTDRGRDQVTATEAAVAASAAVRALNIELFELAMWQTSSSR